MGRKIKFHSLHLLFRLFSRLSDWSGGWRVFVKPKMVLGTLIIGFGMSSCASKQNNQTMKIQGDSVKAIPVNEKLALHDLISKNKLIKSFNSCYTPVAQKTTNFSEPIVSCYDTVTGTPIDTIDNKAQDSISSNIGCYITDVSTNLITANQSDNEPILDVVEQMPQFPGEEEALLKFIADSLRYPNTETCVQGRVILRFVVTKTGTTERIEVLRSLDPAFDKEAIRVVKKLPKWIPGKQNGMNVNVYYTLPISFKLE